jgi:integration host factor subunit alpha
MVKMVLDLIADELVAGNTVKLSSFGTFIVRHKKGRVGRNPKTGQEVPITPRRVLVFRPSQIMKSVINGEEPGKED